MWKSLEFDRRKCGLSYEKAQTEKRERKGDWSHGPFLLFIDPCGSERLHQPTGEPPGARQRPAPQRIASSAQAATLGEIIPFPTRVFFSLRLIFRGPGAADVKRNCAA